MQPVKLLGIPSRRSPIASGSRQASLPQQHGGHGGRAAGGGLRRRAAGFPAGPARAVLPALPPGFAGALLFAGDQQVTGGHRPQGRPGVRAPAEPRRGACRLTRRRRGAAPPPTWPCPAPPLSAGPVITLFPPSFGERVWGSCPSRALAISSFRLFHLPTIYPVNSELFYSVLPASLLFEYKRKKTKRLSLSFR